MTMTKKETAVVDAIKGELALERAMGWPRFKKPTPLPLVKNIPYGEPWQRGWRVPGCVPQCMFVEEIERDGYHFRPAGQKEQLSASRGCPPIYATKREALEALAWDTASYCAGLMKIVNDQMKREG